MSMASLVPGWFDEHFRRMLNYSRLASAGVLFPADRRGTIRKGKLGFELEQSDLAVLRRALATLTKVHFRGGAEEVYPALLHGETLSRGMSDAEIEERMQDTGIIRNRRKLEAARSNARAWLQLEDPAGFVWSFVGGEPKINRFERLDQVPAVSPEAEAMSRALKKAGFSFVGPTICYAYMQACGMVMDHLIDCERHAALVGGD